MLLWLCIVRVRWTTLGCLTVTFMDDSLLEFCEHFSLIDDDLMSECLLLLVYVDSYIKMKGFETVHYATVHHTTYAAGNPSREHCSLRTERFNGFSGIERLPRLSNSLLRHLSHLQNPEFASIAQYRWASHRARLTDDVSTKRTLEWIPEGHQHP